MSTRPDRPSRPVAPEGYSASDCSRAGYGGGGPPSSPQRPGSDQMKGCTSDEAPTSCGALRAEGFEGAVTLV
jgi:hypothetical protein